MQLNKHFAELRRRFTTDREHCGFITEYCVVEVSNCAIDPKTHFEISEDDVELYLDAAVATWHSHPESSANLSLEDHALFAEIRDCRHIIVSPTEIWVYYTTPKGVVMVEERFCG
ncbi:hypothetical protein [Photobacterium sp. GSS17]|uniref:hypothetical protein n=1 Tax=Photobacterium sp. GSS17 TaxID=3020715 RepID=UPI002360D062|nr:hypothetical protein [Photobacterium sp. GSS17]